MYMHMHMFSLLFNAPSGRPTPVAARLTSGPYMEAALRYRDDASALCVLLPNPPFPGQPPALLSCGRNDVEICLRELEQAGERCTQLFLSRDGQVYHGFTDGPPPKNACGLWQCGSAGFQMTLVRTFRQRARELSRVVSRVYMGSVNQRADDGLELVVGQVDDFEGDNALQVLQDTAAARKRSAWPPPSTGLELLDADAHFAIDAVACHLADELSADVELADDDNLDDCPAVAAGGEAIRAYIAKWRGEVTPWPEELS
jgi:hypothetical protein